MNVSYFIKLFLYIKNSLGMIKGQYCKKSMTQATVKAIVLVVLVKNGHISALQPYFPRNPKLL